MFKNKIYTALIGALSLGMASCTSYEIEMPENPEPPAVGPEVSEQVVFEANPRFYATDHCLQALTAELPAIAALGTDILWVMPVCDPGADATSIGSPYCIRDFKAVNAKYGTLADFKALVDAAHTQGMKVILDWIANHTSWDHEWISSHPERYARDASGNIMAANGWTDVAQLNYSEPSTVEAMKDAMLFWLEEAGIDGFRCDYADGVPHEFWQSMIAEGRRVRPDMIMLAESQDYSFYNDGFDMIYDWKFAPTLSSAFTGGKVSDVFVKSQESLRKVPEGKDIMRYAFNHDTAAENNFGTYFGAPAGTPAAYVIAAMLGGTPMLYTPMLTEGLTGTLSFFNYRKLDRSASLTEAYSAINSAFKQTAEVRRGTLKTYADNKAVAFTRSVPGQTMLVIVNTSAEERTVKTPIALAGETMTDLLTGAAVVPGASITLPPYGYLIYMN
ncbi:MAG: alpha-glucosidase C-terminal domain-containing protein [Muribaculaceae bacterium]|nr:alpha-glucosidase C-terminal domain-containing protein [Muribaculaceae bacterium]